MISIIDIGSGNVFSVYNMFKKIGYNSIITNDKEEIKKSTSIILPGVGHFDYCMQSLQKTGLIKTLENEVIRKKKKFLGICVGLQMLFEKSEEGSEKGLSWIKGEVVRFNEKKDLQINIPHMGWNYVMPKKDKELFEAFEENRFYFIHSYHAKCDDKDDILTETEYGYIFPSAIKKNNITAVQFHPEKSHIFGMSFLKRYMET